jgi:hypothetical protein
VGIHHVLGKQSLLMSTALMSAPEVAAPSDQINRLL